MRDALCKELNHDIAFSRLEPRRDMNFDLIRESRLVSSPSELDDKKEQRVWLWSPADD